MISFEREIRDMLERGVLSERSADRAAALERGDVFSLYAELRFIAYAAVLLITTGAGIILKNNYDRIGPDALIAIVGTAAAACYLWVASRRRRRIASAVDDYILLLGALLLSGDVAFAENRYHIFGDEWTAHFLILAVIHAATAYAFDSRLVLSLSLTSLAAWFGLERRVATNLDFGMSTSARAVLCASVILAWAAVDSKLNRSRQFEAIFAHAVTNLAFWGVCGWTFLDSSLWVGFFFAGVFTVLSIWYSFLRKNNEAFAIYGLGYGYVALATVALHLIPGALFSALWFVVTIPILLFALFSVHRRLRSER